jgi:diguanylate cyclase (GGDEF)-like protein
VLPIIRASHERWDGAGYPAGLTGPAIPLAARVLFVCDAFRAMTQRRPYRPARSEEDAIEELRSNAGTQFDPELVRLFCDEVERRDHRVDEPGVVDRALDDPELQHRRAFDEPLLGAAAYALIDNATLLYSHRHLMEEARAHAQAASLHGRPFCVLVVELTDLQRVNAEEGFGAGDAALQRVAREVEQLAVRAGGIAARLSGRRLAVIVPGAGEDEVRGLAEELQPAESIAVGCAAWSPGDSGEDVVARASASTRARVA